MVTHAIVPVLTRLFVATLFAFSALGCSKDDTVRKVVDFDQEADPFGMVAFRINFGRRDGMKNLDLLNHVSRKSRISEIDIGDITVEEAHSLIQVHKGVAGRVAQVMNGGRIGEKRIKFTLEADAIAS